MKRNIILFIEDIKVSIKNIEKFTANITEEQFEDDVMIQDAVIRRLEIIGEAAKKVPENFRNQYSDIEWRKISGLRDVLIHGYFGVDIEKIWQIVKKDIPKLKIHILKIKIEYNYE